jgi:hypothetical protein
MSLLDEKKDEIINLITELKHLIKDGEADEQDVMDALGEIEDHTRDVFVAVEEGQIAVDADSEDEDDAEGEDLYDGSDED